MAVANCYHLYEEMSQSTAIHVHMQLYVKAYFVRLDTIKLKYTYHTNGVLNDTVGVLITIIEV